MRAFQAHPKTSLSWRRPCGRDAGGCAAEGSPRCMCDIEDLLHFTGRKAAQVGSKGLANK